RAKGVHSRLRAWSLNRSPLGELPFKIRLEERGSMVDQAVIIGNSDGIGLALTRALLERSWKVRGLSRSPSPVEHATYQHTVVDVRKPEFPDALGRVLEVGNTRLVIYCAGTG